MNISSTRLFDETGTDTKSRPAKILLISVNYKNTDSIIQLLSSLRLVHGFPSLNVTIVDNGTEETILPNLRKYVSAISNVSLLESRTNRGYFGGAAFALETYLSVGNLLPQWIVVCNNDVVIEDKNFLARLLLQDHQEVGVLAPRIKTRPVGRDQNPFMRKRPGWLEWTRLRAIYSNYGTAVLWDWLSRVKNSRASRSLPEPKREQIYAPHGSFMIFSRRYFEEGGCIDKRLFLYGEELSVAETCERLHLPVVYDPEFTVIHNEHSSVGKSITRFSYECQKRALKYVSTHYRSEWTTDKSVELQAKS